MQKTKLGVSVGALGALTFFSGLFAGYMTTVLLAGYVLLFEENAWLKKSVVKAVVLMAFFSVLIAAFNLIPDAIHFIGTIANVFDGHFTLTKLTEIISVFTYGLKFAEEIIFLLLGIKALNQGTISIPYVDSMVNQFID